MSLFGGTMHIVIKGDYETKHFHNFAAAMWYYRLECRGAKKFIIDGEVFIEEPRKWAHKTTVEAMLAQQELKKEFEELESA